MATTPDLLPPLLDYLFSVVHGIQPGVSIHARQAFYQLPRVCTPGAPSLDDLHVSKCTAYLEPGRADQSKKESPDATRVRLAEPETDSS